MVVRNPQPTPGKRQSRTARIMRNRSTSRVAAPLLSGTSSIPRRGIWTSVDQEKLCKLTRVRYRKSGRRPHSRTSTKNRRSMPHRPRSRCSSSQTGRRSSKSYNNQDLKVGRTLRSRRAKQPSILAIWITSQFRISSPPSTKSCSNYSSSLRWRGRHTSRRISCKELLSASRPKNQKASRN